MLPILQDPAVVHIWRQVLLRALELLGDIVAANLQHYQVAADTNEEYAELEENLIKYAQQLSAGIRLSAAGIDVVFRGVVGHLMVIKEVGEEEGEGVIAADGQQQQQGLDLAGSQAATEMQGVQQQAGGQLQGQGHAGQEAVASARFGDVGRLWDDGTEDMP